MVDGHEAVPVSHRIGPLSEVQQEQWLAGQYGDGAMLAQANLIVLALDGPLQEAAMEQAAEHVWQRHAALRVTVSADGRTQQVVADLPLPWARQDISAEGDAGLAASIEVLLQAPFDTARPPLLKLVLLRLGSARHVLLLHAHELVLDRAAASRLLDELAQSYNAIVAGQPLALETLPLPPAAEAAPVAALDYWRALYASRPDPLALPADRPAPLRPCFHAEQVRKPLPEPTLAGLQALAQRGGWSLHAVLLGAFAALLSRLSGQGDFALGVPMSVDGGMARVLPLRFGIEPSQAVSALFEQAGRALHEAQAHGQATMMGLLRALNLHRQGAAALAAVSFEFDAGQPAPAFTGLQASVRDGGGVALLGELAARAALENGTLMLELRGEADRYDAATLQRWLGHYVTLLGALAGNADAGAMSVLELPLLDTAGRTQLLVDWNDTARDYDLRLGLPAQVAAQAARTPQRIAAECAGEALSHAALEQRTAALAQALARRGIGRGDLVGVYLPRSMEMLVAVLGIMRSGAAYVPLDPEFPLERLAYMAEHAQLRHLLVVPEQMPPEELRADRACLEVGALLTETDAAVVLPEVRGDDLAYVLFTSGSTGKPKGVRILHRNLVNFLFGMREMPGFGADDTLCVVTTLSFDIAGLELYLPLVTGGRMVIATAAEMGNPAALYELMARSGCTVFQTTPSLLRLLQGTGREDVVSRQRLFVGGEAMPVALARSLAGRCRELWNMYGPTETTIWSSAARIAPGSEPIPLGRPIANTRIYVLDARDQPQPPGVLGEIWIAGDGVADGYLHRPDLGAERFVADPFAGGRMYRTGDRGYWRDGQLFFAGRTDDQIKIRGYRIEPGDIEAAAAAETGVRECVVVAQTFGDNDVRLVLYVVAAGDDALVERLRARLHQQLPAYMQPQHIERLEALPKTPNGKIDRKALPRPRLAAASGSRAVARLDDPRQAYLAAIWCELVGVEHVAASDSFFDVGGHSLLAAELVARVERETGVRLRLLDVASSTLAMLAGSLPEAQVAAPAESWLQRLRRRLGWSR